MERFLARVGVAAVATALYTETIELGRRPGRDRQDPVLVAALSEAERKAEGHLKELETQLQKQLARAGVLEKELENLQAKSARQETVIQSMRLDH